MPEALYARAASACAWWPPTRKTRTKAARTAGGLTYGLDDERSRPLTEVTSITFDSETRKIGGTPTSLNTWVVTYWARDVNGVTAYAVTNVAVTRPGGL